MRSSSSVDDERFRRAVDLVDGILDKYLDTLRKPKQAGELELLFDQASQYAS